MPRKPDYMTRHELARFIWASKSHTDSVGEQIEIAEGMWKKGIGPHHDGIKRTEIEVSLGLNLSYNAGTSLNHLVDVGIVEEYQPPGPDGWAISEWLDEIINGRVDEVAADGIEALIDHMKDSDFEDESETESAAIADGGEVSIRMALAAKFEVPPESVETELRDGDGVKKLNDAVDAIEASEDLETRDDYGPIIFRHMAYRYRLSESAVNLRN